ncbi:MAG: hypothetical protein AMJ43_00455 [Coxiella sp. DG_40]|nr:MAG: hypothetical protein AMJ43_00455 [Coxiella sp. DG_40]
MGCWFRGASRSLNGLASAALNSETRNWIENKVKETCADLNPAAAFREYPLPEEEKTAIMSGEKCKTEAGVGQPDNIKEMAN